MAGRPRKCCSRRLPRRERAVSKRVAAPKQAAETTLLTDLLTEVGALHLEVTALRAEVERATSRNSAQQHQVDRLHAELQEHKNGLLAQLQRPWAMGLIQLYDALNREAKDLSVAEASFSARDVAAMLEGFREDVDIVLDQQGVTAYKAPGDTFDPARQTAVKTVPAPSAELAGLVLLRLRPGFEHHGRILRKEWVCVYADANKQ